MGCYDVSVRELNLEVCVRQRFKYYTLELYYIILRQKNPSSSIYDTVVNISFFFQKLSKHSVSHYCGIFNIFFKDRKYMLNVFSFRSGDFMLATISDIGVYLINFSHEIYTSRVMSLQGYDVRSASYHSVSSTLVR